MAEHGLKDGGTRQAYGAGGQKESWKDNLEKGRYDLLPFHPIRKVAVIYARGALKYSSRNWEQGIPLSRFYDSAKRHLDQFYEGKIDEDHLHQCIWNLFAISHTMEMIERGVLPPSLNDLPSYGPPNSPDYRPPGEGVDLPDEHKGKWPEQLESEDEQD